MLGPMPDYRRNRVPGGTYFFTVNLHDRRSELLVARIDVLRAAVRAVRAQAPFHIDAWVVLPEHMHCIWTLPPAEGLRPPAQLRRRERGIWQRRFWEHTIRDDRDYAAHMDYVHFNPVRHGLVARAADWPYSSFRRCVALGLYPADWCAGGDKPAGPASDDERRLDSARQVRPEGLGYAGAPGLKTEARCESRPALAG